MHAATVTQSECIWLSFIKPKLNQERTDSSDTCTIFCSQNETRALQEKCCGLSEKCCGSSEKVFFGKVIWQLLHSPRSEPILLCLCVDTQLCLSDDDDFANCGARSERNAFCILLQRFTKLLQPIR